MTLVYKSEEFKKILQECCRVAIADIPILILGETGTGKEVVADYIYQNSSRKTHNFIKVNCSSMALTLLESELFGHEKGAFTDAKSIRIGKFELANCGTILLDEIGDLHLEAQAKILRVLESGEFWRVGGHQALKTNVRVICSTNKEISKMVKEGTFREDLYYRLNTYTVRIIPLRQRREDIIELANYFLKYFNEKYSKNIKGFDERAMQHMESIPWKGNIRELQRVVELAVVMNDTKTLSLNQLNLPVMEVNPVNGRLPSRIGKSIPLLTLKEMLINALEKTNFSQKEAAKLLGVSSYMVWYRCKQFGITHPRWENQHPKKQKGENI